MTTAHLGVLFGFAIFGGNVRMVVGGEIRWAADDSESVGVHVTTSTMEVRLEEDSPQEGRVATGSTLAAAVVVEGGTGVGQWPSFTDAEMPPWSAIHEGK